MATNRRNVRQQSNRRRLVSGLALALIAAALTIPAAATARPIDVSSTGTAQADQTTAAAQDQGAVTLRRDGSKAVAGPTTAIPTAANSASGFDWGDAMIGAGGALTLVALIGLGGLSLRNRRHVAPAAPSTG